jgi:hypothetical protein
MPPDISATPIPETYGEDAARFLEAHGVVPVSPPLCSSDYDHSLTNPFSYYLTRRLGLISGLRWSKALARGSWFHRRFEYIRAPRSTADVRMAEDLESRLSELRAAATAASITDHTEILNRERRVFAEACCWFDALRAVVVSPTTGTLQDYLLRPHLRHLDSEVTLVHKLKIDGCPAYPSRATIDLLVYDTRENCVWIIDPKTFDGSPRTRLSICPREYQTQHYLFTVKHFLDLGLLQQRYDIPADAKLAGMIHMCVRKPPISFGMKDRAFTLDTSPFKSGPRKGQPRNEKVYYGEPSYELYIQRCMDWYLGRGDYEHEAPLRYDDPPVNYSFTYAHLLLDEDYQREYHSRSAQVIRWATATPHPHNFPQPSDPLAYGNTTPYTPFYLCPVRDWPTIMAQNGLIVQHRDPPIFSSTSSPLFYHATETPQEVHSS